MGEKKNVTLTTDEVVTALKETTKIQIAANYARLVTVTEDEDGNELSDEEIQDQLNEAFALNASEFEQTLQQTAQRIAVAKLAALPSEVVVDG